MRSRKMSLRELSYSTLMHLMNERVEPSNRLLMVPSTLVPCAHAAAR